MVFELIGMFLASAAPAISVYAAGETIAGGVRAIDEMMLPKELLGEDADKELYLHHLEYDVVSQQQLGLNQSSWSVLWSDDELGAYVRAEGIVLAGAEPQAIPAARRELKQLIREGSKRSQQMANATMTR